MEFITHNEKDIDVNGTHFQGYIDITYDKLVKIFGEPTSGDEYKVDAEWLIEFKNGIVATIYNYKDGKNYNGNSGLEKEDITNWHIGGYDQKAVDLVYEICKVKKD